MPSRDARQLGFGTDGVRGVAGIELTAEFAHRLGRAAARVLASPSVTGVELACVALKCRRVSGTPRPISVFHSSKTLFLS